MRLYIHEHEWGELITRTLHLPFNLRLEYYTRTCERCYKKSLRWVDKSKEK